MRLFVVRHYKTMSNARNLIIGWGDSPPEHGWEADLIAVGRILQEAAVEPACIYTSKLERARATGDFFAQMLDVEQQRTSAALNEVNYGILYSKSKKWVAAHLPQYKTDPAFVFPKGESFGQMQARSVACVRQIAKKHAGQDVLMVVHAGVVRGLICHFLGLEYAPNLRRRVSHRYIGIFEFEGDSCRRYDELGSRSSFVKDGILSIPWEGPQLI
jgi:broad specificity phosphatase PhoE